MEVTVVELYGSRISGDVLGVGIAAIVIPIKTVSRLLHNA
jgi:hypothetical protein